MIKTDLPGSELPGFAFNCFWSHFSLAASMAIPKMILIKLILFNMTSSWVLLPIDIFFKWDEKIAPWGRAFGLWQLLTCKELLPLALRGNRFSVSCWRKGKLANKSGIDNLTLFIYFWVVFRDQSLAKFIWVLSKKICGTITFTKSRFRYWVCEKWYT